MTLVGPFQPSLFCDSVLQLAAGSASPWGSAGPGGAQGSRRARERARLTGRRAPPGGRRCAEPCAAPPGGVAPVPSLIPAPRWPLPLGRPSQSGTHQAK